MANKYLDLAGLQRLVNKIKELIPTRTSELDNDNGFITIEDIPDSTWESIQNKPDTFAPSEHVHSIGSVTGLQDELNSKETPSGAQSKADVAESNAKSYVDGKVLTDVPVGAKFTDTVYTHPASHPASMITGLPTSLPADGGNADTVGGFTVGVNVPADAVFTDTDTITTINGKTGAIAKEDIVALGIPSQDTNTTYSEITTEEIDTGTASTLRTITGRRVKYILDKVQGWIGNLTKADVGLSNVDNIKQMPISGGILENYREKLATVSAANGSINLGLGNVFQHSPSGNRTYSITHAVTGQAYSFTLIINMGSTVRTLTFPPSIKWQGGEIPDMSTANKTYVLTFMTIAGGAPWLGMFGGEF